MHITKKILTSTFIVVLISLSFLLSSNIHIVYSASQPLQSFNPCINRVWSPINITKHFGIDYGKITYHFCKMTISWFDNWTPMHNITYKISTINGLVPSITLSQNSTTIDYHIVAPSALHAFSGDMYFILNGYNYNVIIKGLFAGIIATFPLNFIFIAPNALAWNNTASIYNNHIGFDWTADSSISSFINTTKTLTFTVPNSFTIDPIAIDGAASSACSLTSGCTKNNFFTTTTTNDVLVCFTVIRESTASIKMSTIKANAGALTFVERNDLSFKENNYQDNSEWVYNSWNSNGAVSVVFTLSGTAANLYMTCFGINDVYLATPYDPNGIIPIQQEHPYQTFHSTVNVTTSNANDLLVTEFFSSSSGSITSPSGYSALGTGANCILEYEIVSATQSSVAVEWSRSTVSYMSQLFDAFQQIPPFLVTVSNTYAYSQIITSINIGGTASITNTYSQTLPSINLGETISVTNTYTQSFNPTLGITASNTLNYTQSISPPFLNIFISELYNYTQSIIPQIGANIALTLTYTQSVLSSITGFAINIFYTLSYAQTIAGTLACSITTSPCGSGTTIVSNELDVLVFLSLLIILMFVWVKKKKGNTT